MHNPELTLYEQFYKLTKAGGAFDDYLDRKMVITPFEGAYGNAGFVAVVEGSPPVGTLFCVSLDLGHWMGFFYSGGQMRKVFNTMEPQPTKNAEALTSALFAFLETNKCGKQSQWHGFEIAREWKDPLEIKAHWIGSK